VTLSLKVFDADIYRRWSRTTKVGSNEQEFDTEASRVGVSKHIIVKPYEYQKTLLVDQVDIDGKNLLLPGEISAWVDHTEKSAEVIVLEETSEDC